ncbi:MAG: hypothetical protein GX177_09050, partial [Firmicutes bacterium]|nr:hypothetical protein [Bacillota bacterium]
MAREHKDQELNVPRGTLSSMCAWHAYCADGLKEALSPNQREDNQQARATLVTVLSGGSRG